MVNSLEPTTFQQKKPSVPKQRPIVKREKNISVVTNDKNTDEYKIS